MACAPIVLAVFVAAPQVALLDEWASLITGGKAGQGHIAVAFGLAARFVVADVTLFHRAKLSEPFGQTHLRLNRDLRYEGELPYSAARIQYYLAITAETGETFAVGTAASPRLLGVTASQEAEWPKTFGDKLKAGLLTLGGVALAIGGAGVVTVIDAPTAAFTVEPPTGGMASVTAFSFDARGSRPGEGRDLTFEWDFGDSQRANGPVITHVFDRAGTFDVRLTVEEKDRRSASTSTSIRVQRNLIGTWRGAIGEAVASVAFFAQDRASFHGTYTDALGRTGVIAGSISPPPFVCPCSVALLLDRAGLLLPLVGTIDGNVQRMSGVISLNGATQEWTLERN